MTMMHTATTTTMPRRGPRPAKPGSIRLSVQVNPADCLGQCDVQLGLGRGSRGKGVRPGDCHAVHVAAVRRLADDLVAYARDYERAALAEDPFGWWERLAIATGGVRPGRGTTLCACGQPTTDGESCDDCMPF